MAYDFKQLKEKVKGVDEWLKKEYLALRTGIATPAVLDGVQVDAYGSKMHLNQVASIAVEDARAIRVNPYDKSQGKEIEKAIVAANLGVSVAVDEKGVRVFFPQLTGESRALLVKNAKAKLEDARIRIRAARDECLKDIDAKEKEGGMSQDDKFRHKNEMQKIVDEANKALEVLLEKKEKEIHS